MDDSPRSHLPGLAPSGDHAARSGHPSQGTLAPAWSTWRRTWPGHPGWPGVHWQASIWTGFLALTDGFLLYSHAQPWQKVLGTAGLTAFAVLYIIEISIIAHSGHLAQLGPQSTLHDQLAPAIRPLILLGASAVAAIIAITWYFPMFLPYFTAIILFTCRIRTGLTACVGMYLVSLGIVLSAGVDAASLYMTLGCISSSGFVVLSRFSAEQELTAKRQAQAEAAAAEREEIGRDLHDILGHSLTVLTLKAEVAQRLVHRSPEAAENELAEIIELSRAALADVRATVTRLRTPDLASQIESSRTAFIAAQIHAEITGSVEDVPLGRRELASWTLREATTNILRHAAATHVQVDITPGRLLIVDNGRGLEGTHPGNGLTGLRERIEATGGELRIISPAPSARTMGRHPGPGTEMEVVL